MIEEVDGQGVLVSAADHIETAEAFSLYYELMDVDHDWARRWAQSNPCPDYLKRYINEENRMALRALDLVTPTLGVLEAMRMIVRGQDAREDAEARSARRV